MAEAPGKAGRKGENFAAELLTATGCRVVARNWHSRYGELDIVAVKDGVIRFVEVKTRRRGSVESGSEAVGASKRRKIIRTALLFLQNHPEYDLQPRFDVLLVTTDGRGHLFGHDYIEGAFDGDGETG